jgi:hypothetical protein
VFGRRQAKRTHKQQLMEELMESYGHLRLAAGHVAGGAAEKVTPAYDRARSMATDRWGTTKESLAPLYEQVREGAANARKEIRVSKKRKKWPIVVGILAAGAAAGACGAMVARRRRAAAQWDEYDPVPPLDEAGYGTEKVSKKMTAGAAAVADSVSSGAGKVADSLHNKGRSGRRDANEPGPFAGFSEESEATRNSRS